MSSQQSDNIIGLGVYTLQEAAFYGSLSPQKLSRWLWGTTNYDPVIDAQFPSEKLVSLYDLLQAKAINVARKEGIPLPKIRQAIKRIKANPNMQYPLARKHRLVWYERELHIVKNGVYQITGGAQGQESVKDIIIPYAKQLHFDEQGLACMWIPYKRKGIQITLNPKVQFGQPLVGDTGYRADVLNHAYVFNGSYESVMDEFGVEMEEVKTAVFYMKSLIKSAA